MLIGFALIAVAALLCCEASRVFRRLLSVRRSCDDDKEQVFA